MTLSQWYDFNKDVLAHSEVVIRVFHNNTLILDSDMDIKCAVRYFGDFNVRHCTIGEAHLGDAPTFLFELEEVCVRRMEPVPYCVLYMDSSCNYTHVTDCFSLEGACEVLDLKYAEVKRGVAESTGIWYSALRDDHRFAIVAGTDHAVHTFYVLEGSLEFNTSAYDDDEDEE